MAIYLLNWSRLCNRPNHGQRIKRKREICTTPSIHPPQAHRTIHQLRQERPEESEKLGHLQIHGGWEMFNLANFYLRVHAISFHRQYNYHSVGRADVSDQTAEPQPNENKNKAR